jgi:hypothetical protein
MRGPSAGNRRRRRSIRSSAKPYMLVSRARDGRLHAEQFKSAADYRSRLVSSDPKRHPVSMNELIDLLESC